jgi:hypothetical protein
VKDKVIFLLKVVQKMLAGWKGKKSMKVCECLMEAVAILMDCGRGEIPEDPKIKICQNYFSWYSRKDSRELPEIEVYQ